MATLLFAPGIEVRISTARDGIIDVSEDIIRGGTDVAENQVGSLNLTLNNHLRKYDGIFTPNDRIVVKMKRISWVQVFSGYLDSVPVRSVYPREVPITASCTMKKLKFRYWDPTSEASVVLMDVEGDGFGSPSKTDGGVRDRLMRMLTEVGEWPRKSIHIGALPPKWFDHVEHLQEKLLERVEINLDDLSQSAVMGGRSMSDMGTKTVQGIGEFTGVLPDYSGKVSWFGGPKGAAYGNMALSGESGIRPKDNWFAAMRFPYQGYVNGRITGFGSPAQRRAAIGWWSGRRLVVVNPKNHKAICVRAADWGPAKWANRVLDVSQQGLAALGASTDDNVEIRFAPNNMPLGPVKTSGAKIQRGNVSSPHPGATTGGTAGSAGRTTQKLNSVKFRGKGGLKPHVAAAQEFMAGAWPGITGWSLFRPGSRIAGSGKLSEHALGRAIDAMNGSGGNMPNKQQLALGTSIAAWFVQNPNVFGVYYVIWNNKVIFGDGRGWQTYAGGRWRNNPNLGHFNHVHVSFNSNGPKSLGPMGGGWVGSDMKGFPDYSGVEGPDGSGYGMSGDSHEGDNLINSYQWGNMATEASMSLYGIRALMNDVPLMGSIDTLTKASMRSFMSAPNGDFISWFPDYFGSYKTAGRMIIEDIELTGDGFTMMWDDSRLKTHIYATGSWGPFSQTGGTGGLIDLPQMMSTAGIANVEYPEIMEALFNISPKDMKKGKYFDPDVLLDRFGARPEVINMGEISGAQAEFWLALHMFQMNWARQFSASVSLSFMPEVYPGMLLYIPSQAVQVYVTGVSHTFDFESGFHTRVTVVAPSSTDKTGPVALPKSVTK